MKKAIFVVFIAFCSVINSQNIWLPFEGPVNKEIYSIYGGFAGTGNGIYFSEGNNIWKFGGLAGNKVISISSTVEYTLAGTEDGVFYSSNGTDWTQSPSPGMKANNFRVINMIQYLACDGGIFTSSDNGAHWDLYALGSLAAVIDLAGTSSGRLIAVTDDRCLYQDDQENWVEFNRGLETSGITGIRNVSHYAGEDVVMVITENGPYFINGFDIGDSTKSWERRINGLNNLEITCHDQYNEIIRIGTKEGIYYSTDKGENWQKNSGMDLEISSLSYLTASTLSGGVYKAPNVLGNTTYSQFGITNYTAIEFDQYDNIYLGTGGYGIFKSTDGGANFAQINQGLTNLNITDLTFDVEGYLFASTDQGAFKSTDNGSSWNAVLPMNVKIFSLLTSAKGNPLETFAGGESSFYLLESNNNWNGGTDPLSGNVYDISFSPQMDKYIAACSGGLYSSASDYIAWTKMDYFNCRAVTVGAGGEIFVGLSGGNIKRSTNNGVSWEDAGWLASRINDLTIDNDGNLWAAHDYGVSKSTDNGTIWEFYNTGLNPSGALKEALSLKVSNGGILHLGTLGLGLFRLLDPTGIDEESNPVPTDFQLLRNYPNPFNPTTTISYSVQPSQNFSAPTTLKIYNSLGAEVTELVNEYKAPGEYEIEWNAEGFASGIYYCRLVSGHSKSVIKLMLLK